MTKLARYRCHKQKWIFKECAPYRHDRTFFIARPILQITVLLCAMHIHPGGVNKAIYYQLTITSE